MGICTFVEKKCSGYVGNIKYIRDENMSEIIEHNLRVRFLKNNSSLRRTLDLELLRSKKFQKLAFLKLHFLFYFILEHFRASDGSNPVCGFGVRDF